MTEVKQKESIVKMLLSAPSSINIPAAIHSVPQVNAVPQLASPNETDENVTKLISYFQPQVAEKQPEPFLMDHTYSRPWNWRPETSYIRPTKSLFVWKSTHKHTTSAQPLQSNAANIDVVSIPATPTPVYDLDKARGLMEECERHAAYARSDDGEEDWEEKVSKLNWTTNQTRLFNSMVKILNTDRMARLTYTGNWNEPILRRTVIDKSVQRTRSLMASVSWDTRLTQWLHNILIENLSTSYLAAYFDILQTLKSKLPTFVEKMIFGPTAASRVGATSNESLFPLLKRAWDPVASSLIQDKPKKLPGNPVFIIAPTSPSIGPNFSKRLHKWTNLLTSLAHVITVTAHVGSRTTTLPSCADQMLAVLRTKIQEVRTDCPNRPIVLIGFNTGAALVCQVAEMEHVAAVVCMGFPLLTAEGKRGEPDDVLLDMQCPVLFVIGQNSHRTSREDMEDLRERMRIETGLVVVGSADDYLRMSKSKKRAEGITQSIVDRCILDEISDFVGSILSSPYPRTPAHYPAPVPYVNEHPPKRMKLERIRNNSNGSSIDSEPPSPQPLKLTRPGLGYKDWTSGQLSCSPASQQMAVISSRSVLSGGNTLSNLLQKDSGSTIRPVSTSAGTTIKVLENIPIPAGTKLLSTGGRTVDLSKVTLVNTAAAGGKGTSNVVLLSDGTKCIRSSHNPNLLQSVKTIGGNVVMNVTGRKSSQGVTKLVPTRRQITTKPRQQVTSLAPPSNLTTADILDLPIIFADNDTSLLSGPLDDTPPTSLILPHKPKQPSKYVVINKQTILPNTQAQIKRPATSIRQSGQKYARIIINQNQLQETEDGKRHVLITNQKLKQENEIVTISPKKMDTSGSLEFVDLETELKTNTVPKPIHTTVVSAQSIKNKPDIKHLNRNVTLRVPISMAGTSTKITDANDVFLLNRVVNRKKLMKNAELKQKGMRFDGVYEESIEEPDVEK